MSDMNKYNIHYFENGTMRGLYDVMDEWQHANDIRLLSLSVEKDGGKYCCIALSNPTEVVITNPDGRTYAWVYKGKLNVALPGDVY